MVIYYYDHDHHELECTVVTEHSGELTGRRVVRCRESECRQYYASGQEVHTATAPAATERSR